MTRPTGFGAECEHGRLARKCERCDDAEELAHLRGLVLAQRELLEEEVRTCDATMHNASRCNESTLLPDAWCWPCRVRRILEGC